jgi:N-acetylneuraminate synthase
MSKKTFVIAEIGINHNGDLAICKKLIDGAVLAGCDAVKFQKRTIDVVYTQELLASFRESPWGKTQRAQKEGLEFGIEQYQEIDSYCKDKGIHWFGSAWDVQSVDFLASFDLPYHKIASAMLTDMEILKAVAKLKRHTFISTGMSTMEEIAEAVDVFRSHNCPFELMQCNSTYPMKNEMANLNCILTLRDKFGCDVGYSGHEVGRVVSSTAVALGATSIERHITLDRTMYGSDQAASIEIDNLIRLLADIRTVEACLGDGIKVVSETEVPIRKKLRGN